MRRRTWLILLAIPLLLVAADVAYWRFAARQLRDGYAAWVKQQSARGWDIAGGDPAIGGWPTAATVTVPNVTLRHAGSDVPGLVSAASAAVVLSVPLFLPTSLRLSTVGPVHLRADGGPDMIVTSEENAAVVPLRNAGTVSVTVTLRDLRVEPATGAWHATAGLTKALVNVRTAAPEPGDTAPAATFLFTTEAIGLPTGFKWPLGPNISSFTVEGQVNGAWPHVSGITDWAEAWRDGGGSLQITHLATGWGPLGLAASATLALDDQLQPMGSANSRIVGYAPTLDRLAAAGILTKSAATAAKAVLSLLADGGGPDRPSSVEVPLTLQYRTLAMRQVPLVRLPEVDWPSSK